MTIKNKLNNEDDILYQNQQDILKKIFTGLYHSFEADRKAGIGVFKLLPSLEDVPSEIFLAPRDCTRDLGFLYEKGTLKKNKKK